MELTKTPLPFFQVLLPAFAFFLRISLVKPLISIPYCRVLPSLNWTVSVVALKNERVCLKRCLKVSFATIISLN